MKTNRDIFQAIADPTRRSILLLLTAQAMTPNALAAHFQSSRQAVSKHIQVLCDCQLLSQKQEGRTIYYHFNPSKMKELRQWMEQLELRWEKRFEQLDEILKK